MRDGLWVRLLATSLAARLPQAMLGIALMVHGDRVAGSFAAGGLAAGGFALGVAAGGPWWGRRADRSGATRALLVPAVLQVVVLASTAVLPVGSPTAVLVACGVATGLATPPVGACLRAVLPRLTGSPEVLRRAYGAEATALELTFIAGPAIALGVAAAVSTSTVLLLCAAVLLASVLAYLAQTTPLVHALPGGEAPTGWDAVRRALRNRRLLGLTVVMALVGVTFGATEVGVVAATGDEGGSHGSAGLLLALWGAASLTGGVLHTWRGPLVSPRLLGRQLGVFAVGHLVLVTTARDPRLLAVGLVLAGAVIAPLFATVHALAGRSVSSGRATEAFSWLASATSVGSAAGASVGGLLSVLPAGPTLALALAAVSGVAGLLVASAGLTVRPAAAVVAPEEDRSELVAA